MSGPISPDKDRAGLSPCPYCGAPGVGGYEGCNETLERITSHFLTRPGFSYYYSTQRAMVDCYSLQHPEVYCASTESYASHLAGVCVFLLYEGHRYIYNAVEKWLIEARELSKPEAPDFRGRMTVVDLLNVKDPPTLQNRVTRWAEEVWAAYAHMHNMALTCVESALGNQ